VRHSILAFSFLGVLGGLSAIFPIAETSAKGQFIGADEIKEGMKGYGLTVFKGTKPERFDVEVIGVLSNFLPSQSLILVKTPHPRLDITKNVQGMSGSPIYLDGRLAGAYAYSWASFPAEPVAGVTPIAPMLHELRRPTGPGFFPLRPLANVPVDKKRPTSTVTSFEGDVGSYDLRTHIEQLKARLAQIAPSATQGTATRLATPISISGLTPRGFEMARQMFEPLGLVPAQGGGGTGTMSDAPLHYENGGALGVQMARGDVSFMGLGTTTFAEGSRAAGFGHPMMGGGDVALPACIGRVHWIYASAQHSSKIGESARPLGALVQDRQSAVVVDETKTAPTIPMRLRITGINESPKNEWNVELAEDKLMTAGLSAAVLVGAIESTVAERRDITWSLQYEMHVRGHGKVVIEDVGFSRGNQYQEAKYWFWESQFVRTIGAVLNNPWEEVHVDRIEAVLNVKRTSDIDSIKGVELVDPIVDPGGTARVRVRLQPLYGPETTTVFEAKIPIELAGRDVEIEIVPGYALVADSARPESVDELLAAMSKRIAPARTAVVQIALPGSAVAMRGHVSQRLPAFAVDTLRPSSSDRQPATFTQYQRTIVPTARYLSENVRIRVKVRALPSASP
jgi:hypothetical protein